MHDRYSLSNKINYGLQIMMSILSTLAIYYPSVKILRRSSQGNPSVGGLNQRGVAKYSDFGPLQGYISETVQDRC